MNDISKLLCGFFGRRCGKRAFVIFILVIFLLTGAVKGEDNLEESRGQLPYVKLSQQTHNLLKEGKWEEAIDVLEEKYQLTVADPNLKYYLAYCYEQMAAEALKKSKYREAIDQLEQALFYVKDDPGIFMGIGICHFQLSQYLEAEKSFSEVVRLNPESYLGHKKLGEIYYLINDKEKALLHWEEALRLKPEDRVLDEKIQDLRRYLDMNYGLENEMDSVFSVSFEGSRDLQLSGKVLEILGDIYYKIGRDLNLYPSRQIQVVLVTKQDFFDITNSPQWAAGVYEGHIKVPVDNYDLEKLKKILCHEYIHAVVYDRMANRCPWWLNEGLAQYFADDEGTRQLKQEMAAVLVPKVNIPILMNLPGSWFKKKELVGSAYVLAFSGIDFFLKKFTIFQLQAVLDLMAEGQSMDSALTEITAYRFAEFEAEWKGSF